jgi:TolA-binding protein
MKHIILSFSSLLILSACSAGLEKRMDRDFREIRSIQAEQTAAITEMRHEIRELTGRLDEIQHQTKGRTTQLESAIQQLGTRVPPPSGVPAKLLALDEQRITPIKGAAADMYRDALRLLRNGEFEQAHASFTEFAKRNPGTAFTDNAFFWSGISSMKLDRYERAIGEFSDVYEKYPAEDMVAPALYYMADALFHLGLGNDGVLTLQKLLDDHPDSEYAKKAKERLGDQSTKKR